MDIFNNAQKAWLLLEDGTIYEGYGLGCSEDAIGELVFNMLVLVGAVKMADRVVREMMGL